MKISFIENRYKTIFWAALAKELRALNCATSWLVQNPAFSPTSEPQNTVYKIPFPSRADLTKDNKTNELKKVIKADRYINYFGGSEKHYAHYKKSIEHWLDDERPDIVIGESTLFHELITINACRDRKIPYLNPSMPGYPGGRYAIYSYDTKDTVGKNNEIPSRSDCLAMAEAIRKRERIPDYMIPPSGKEPERSHPLPSSIQDRLIKLYCYIAGERYNTPAPWKKLILDRKVRRRLREWQKIASDKAEASKGMRLALYPLQMQPEANLDVWGQEFRDQAKLISALSDALPDGWHMHIKANPKAKYELSDELINVLRSNPKVSPVPLTDGMAKVFSEVDLICTVTGTVAVECVLSGKPLAQLGPSIVSHGPGCVQLRKAEDITAVAHSIETNSYLLAEEEDRIALIEKLYATTFPGKVSDPSSSPQVMAAENIKEIASTLLRVAKSPY